MFAVVNISSGSGSVRAVELGCYAGAAVLLVNAFLEYGLGHSTERYGNLLGNPNTYAFALLSAVLFATRRLLFMRGRGPNFLVQAALVLLVLSASYQVFVGTGSRKGMIGLAAVGVFSVIGSWRLRPRREVLRLALPILVVAGVILAVGSEATRLSRLQSLVEFASGTAIREASASTRASMAREALELWSEKPLAGWGFDQFRYLSARGDYAHSNVLELLANGGLIGMTLYYLAWVYLAKHIVCGWRRSQDREDRLELFWTAFTGLVIACWGFAAVQYEQKLDAVILAALSTIPATVASRCRTRTPRATERHETSFVTCYGVPRT
jgi:O-antigen ligase